MKLFNKDRIEQIADKHLEKIFKDENLLPEELNVIKQGFRLGYSTALKETLINFRFN